MSRIECLIGRASLRGAPTPSVAAVLKVLVVIDRARLL
jgi:hypothetical protein